MNRQQVAEDAARHFTTDTRPDGTTYHKLRDTRPEWLYEAVREAHGRDSYGAPALLPDDYRYQYAAEAVQEIADADPDEDLDDVAERATEPDVYTADLTTWLGSHGYRPGYVDEAVQDLDARALGAVAQIALGQRAERREVFDVMAAAILAQAEDDDDQEQDD